MAREKISIIVPCYNEGRRIHNTIESIQEMEKRVYIYDFEIVLSDDGSTDDTYMKIRPFISPKVKYTRTERNFGKGRAVYNGLAVATNKLCLILDADLSCAPQELFKIDFGQLPEHFVVKGQRVQVVPQPKYRLFLGRCWQYLTYLLTGFNFDTQAPFTLLRLPDGWLGCMTIDGFAYDVEILMYAKQIGIPIKKMAVDYINDPQSSVKILHIIQMFYDLLRIGKKKFYSA